jgi:glycine betaine/proline transport system ATP-binding protein
MPETDAPAAAAKLVCRSVWKFFGPDAERLGRAADAGTLRPDELAGTKAVAAVRDVSLSVREGECFVIMGLSGSGKSTLVRCMSRLVEPSAGEILFDGENLLSASERRMIEIRRRHMGMVFQNFALLPHLTVLGNVAFPLDVQGVPRAAREARAMEMIGLVGLSGREHFFPRELSGGQQQRVGIARSLAVEPDLWFLDEPFSALDPLIRREMQDEFMRLQSVLKKTIVFITHDFDEAIRLADRIAIMKDGEVIQIGTPEELVVNPATDYVAEFTRDVQRAKVISARSLMRPCQTEGHPGTVAPEDRIATFSARLISAGKPFAVVNGTGKPIGEVTPDAVIDLLAGIDRSGAQA